MLSVLDDIVGTFGPFLIPAVVFAAGLVGYGVLFLINKMR